MTPAILRQAGEALYGPHWQTALARALQVNDRTMRRWIAGDSPLPDGLNEELAALCRHHGRGLLDMSMSLSSGQR